MPTDTVARRAYRPSTDPAVNRTARLSCAWSGVVCTVLFAIGFVVFARWLPFPSPNLPAEQLAHDIAANATGLRIGVIFMIIGFGLFAPFVVGVALELRRTDGDHPALTYLQMVCGGGGSAILALSPMFFGILAYRAGSIPPTTTQALYDIGWFCYEDTGYKLVPGLLAWRISKLFLEALWPTPVAVATTRDEPRKERAMRCYASQIKSLGADWDLENAMLSPEQYWRLAPPPAGWEVIIDDIR